jgi:CRISPR-associated protein Cas5d
MYATVLIDVCYKLYADVMPNRKKANLPESAMHWDGKTTAPGHAYQCIFQRRLRRGESYSIPVLGWKEFTPSYFGELRSSTSVLSDSPDILIPSMLRQVFSKGYLSPVSYVYDNDLIIRGGVLEYPKRGDDVD